MPKIIFENGKTQEIGYNEAKKIERFYLKPNPMQKEWLDKVKCIIYENKTVCLHNWSEWSQPDYNSRKIVGRKCVKCKRIDILDLK